MVRNVLATPLSDGNPTFVLAGIDPADRVHEMEFLHADEQDYRQCVVRTVRQTRNTAEILSRLDLRPARGMLKGFIDMVFPLWKTVTT
jgi:ATP-dependent exoDNAse (exonuclease V) beta subunit